MSENKPPQSTGTEVVTKALVQGSLIGMQAGCVTVLVVIAGLVAGRLLDRLFNTENIFSLGLILLAIPVALGATVYSVLRSTQAMRAQSTPQTTKKEDSLEETH